MKIKAVSYGVRLHKNDYSATELVQMVLEDEYREDQIACLQVRLEKLAEITGRLIEQLPEEKWLEIAPVYGVRREDV